MELGEAEVPEAIERAVALHRGGRIADAEKSYRNILRLFPRHPEALNLLGLVNYQKGDALTAVDLIGRAIAEEDRVPKYHANLGTALVALGRVVDARAALRTALELDPDHAEAHGNLGVVLQRMGELDGAVLHGRRAVELQPRSAVAHNNLGNALQMRGEHEAAAASYLRAVQVEPGYVDAFCNLGITWLRLREAGKALRALDAALALNGTNRRALAWQAVARHEMDTDESPLSRLNDTIGSFTLDAPAPYDSLERFNDALALEVRSDPSLAWQPIGKTTVNGGQTGNLLDGPGEAVRALDVALRRAVDSYVASQRRAHTGGYFDKVPERRVLRMWGTMLSDQGHQLPHIHPAGWISGVYYVGVPRSIGAEDAQHAGWIEFGQPGYGVPCDRSPDLRLFEPKPGRLLLFPSFLFHRTVPFDGDEGDERISIAFDVYPAR